MGNYNLTKDVETRQIAECIPAKYPQDLQECLQICENFKYSSYGFGFIVLDYDYHNKCWGILFRNPININIPNIQERTPIKAVHALFDSIKLEVEKLQ